MLLHVKGWEDGEPIERTLETPDRWVMHSADEIIAVIDPPGGGGQDGGPQSGGGLTVAVKQRPRDIPASRMGVGACLWEGELLMAAYLAAQPRHRYIGARVVELGAGPGLAGLMLAKLGARVAITDIARVLPLIEENIRLNGLSSAAPATTVSSGGGGGGGSGGSVVGSVGGGIVSGGSAVAEELEWGKEGYLERAASLAGGPGGADLVIAADVTYVDGDGASPSTEAFVAACRALSGPSTRVLVSFELRSAEVKAAFLAAAGREFSGVERLPQASLPKGWRAEHLELYQLRV